MVVVGILLALQVDQWRTERQERADEAIILQSLLSDLNLEYEALANARERADVQRNASVAWTAHLLATQPRSESVLRESYRNAIFTLGWRPITGAYRSLVGSGELRLISNPELRDALVSYYEERQSAVAYRMERALLWNDRLINAAKEDVYRVGVGDQPEARPSITEIVVVQPLGDIPRNPQLLFALGWHTTMFGAVVRATSGAMDDVDALRTRLSAHLESL